MTSIIDNSLCFLTVEDGIVIGSGENVVDYAKRLLASGADYIQIDNRSSEYFANSDFSCGERCIFRVRCPADIETALEYNFAYVTVPICFYMDFSPYREALNINLEISSYDNMSFSELYNVSKNITRFCDINMFTFVVGNSEPRADFAAVLANIRRNTIASVAVCPLNTCCCGADIAADAFAAGAEAVFLSHVSGGRYTTLFEFVNSACLHYRIKLADSKFEDIVNTAAGIVSLERKIKEGISVLPSFNVDEGHNFRHVKPERPARRKEDGVERKLYEFEFDGEEVEEIRKIIGNLSPDLYRKNNKQ